MYCFQRDIKITQIVDHYFSLCVATSLMAQWLSGHLRDMKYTLHDLYCVFEPTLGQTWGSYYFSLSSNLTRTTTVYISPLSRQQMFLQNYTKSS